uniref:DDE_3 domain-containing protein n=1 Tax=Heterorhabditis bacteriophora TaxID=37862 RepID=A0A1I7WS02_HETBA
MDRTKVVFSDDSKFNRFGSYGKKYVRRRPGEEFMPKCTIPIIKHDGGSVMVWTAFNRNGPGPFHIVEEVKGWVEIGYSNRITIQNSQVTPRNVGSIRRNHQNGVAVPESRLESHSTPMERCREGELEVVIKKVWAQISVQRSANLVDSMPRRCDAVIKNFGYPTKY